MEKWPSPQVRGDFDPAAVVHSRPPVEGTSDTARWGFPPRGPGYPQPSTGLCTGSEPDPPHELVDLVEHDVALGHERLDLLDEGGNELRRDGLAVDRHNLLHPSGEPRKAYVTAKLEGRPGPVIAVSDWMRAVQEQIREWVPQPFSALGTDGWGMSDTRGALRRHFLVDAQSIVVQTLASLAQQGQFEQHRLQEAVDRYQLRDASAAEAGNTEGSG